ncbi:putative F-box protein At5g55150 [Mangifera indica]|uniref:putative F-box protein At5g55150 n=1 Tax=Mangifera indica TaxID=29780 RepID=UPI001CFB356E|nr:putative F-box protein At5g55150 [Mangifera indica]
MVDWANLLPDVLLEITTHLTSCEDFVAFGSVCSSWRSVAIMGKPGFLFKLAPLLMLAPEKPTYQRGFYSFSEDLTRYFILPEVNSRRCLSSRGWLLTIAEADLSMALLHPFSRFEIALPHPKTIKDWEDFSQGCDPTLQHVVYISKFVLSTNPRRTSDYLVMVLHEYGGKVAYCKPGDKSWTTMESSWLNHDITCYKGQYYVINTIGQIMQCDLTTNVLVKVAQMPHLKYPQSNLYIMESAGALIVVERYSETILEDGPYGTTGFKVFQVDLGNNKWTEIKDLGNRTLFLGYNSSFSEEALYCKANCIYFTDDCLEDYFDLPEGGGKDMGIYNILDGSIEPHFHFEGSSYSSVNPPMWVQQR